MFPKSPSVQIDKVEKIEINSPPDPFLRKFIIEYLNNGNQITPYTWQPYNFPSNPVRSESEYENFTGLKFLDYISKGVSILSGIAVIIFIIILLSGQTSIGNVQIGTLLTILSFTLVGGVISIGGVKMFSINANLRKAKEKIEQVITIERGCPFINLVVERGDKLYRPGNPRFCVKCPLGIDTDYGSDGGLIHICSVYPVIHRLWRQLPGTDNVMNR